jgi:glycosyltransferase involved in cell wall biosynthesis
MITGDFPPAVTGVGDYTHRLVESLAAAGATVDVFTGATQAGGEASPQDWSLGVVPRVLRALDRLGPEALVHIQYPALAYGRRPAINCLPAVLKLLRPRCRVVVTMHEFRGMRRRWKLRVIPMVMAADALILPDELNLPEVSRWALRARDGVVAIPLGPNITPEPTSDADRSEWRTELGLPGSDPIVVFFGGVYEHKGILELVAAIQGLRASGVPARLLVLGAPNSDHQFQERVKRLLEPEGADRWARWIVSAAPDVVSRSLQACDIAALPFRSGAMANRGSLLVVLAHGVPVVTTRTAATPAAFGPGTGMALVPAADPLRLQACLVELLRSPDSLSALREAALAYASRFSWPAIACRTLQVYRALPGQQGEEITTQ